LFHSRERRGEEQKQQQQQEPEGPLTEMAVVERERVVMMMKINEVTFVR
jgi:hypothetical protein